jgi:hypothetical protein
VNALFYKGFLVTKARLVRQSCFPFCCFASAKTQTHLQFIERRALCGIDFEKSPTGPDLRAVAHIRRTITMNKFLIASAAALSLTTFAVSGALAEAPLVGNYDAAVLNSQTNVAETGQAAVAQFSASLPVTGGAVYGNQDPAQGNYSANITETDLRH